MTELTPEADCFYWWPVPGDYRHAFKGARRWDGRAHAQAVCGTVVPLAAVNEMDWIHVRPCGYCWETLVAEQVPDYNPHHSSDRDRKLALEEAQKL